jgi:hypothetical protein
METVVASVVAVLETVVASVVLTPLSHLCEMCSSDDDNDFLLRDLIVELDNSSLVVVHSIGDKDVCRDGGVICDGDAVVGALDCL